MDILLLVLTVALPLGKILLFPARTMGRGGSWTLVGAAMIVGLMMALWFGVQSLSSGPAAAAAVTAPDGATAQELTDLDALSKLL